MPTREWIDKENEITAGVMAAEQAFQQLLKQAIAAHESRQAPGPLGIVQLDHDKPLDAESPELLAEIVQILNRQIGTMAERLNAGTITEALAFHRGKLLETVGAYIEARIEVVELNTGTTMTQEPEFFDFSDLNPHAAEPGDPWGKKFPETGHRLNGQRFGRLTVLGKIAVIKREAVVLCRCVCGTYHLAKARELTAGGVLSCGHSH